eukprot:GEMP01042631.1.p1 GENE.GEMP01042631.1~~GEMP01042631.1.p1  ORF type:complete len:465 (+),score=109.36 GEMP01042631.1:89-1483(+)
MRRNFVALSSRLRRSVHFVPGGKDKFLTKSIESEADSLVLDLEDSVLQEDKEAVRNIVKGWLWGPDKVDFHGKEVFVRINALNTNMWERDLEAAIHADGFMIPKVNGADDMALISDKIAALEKQYNLEVGSRTLLPIATETADGVINLPAIAKSKRVTAVTWGCEDLSAYLGSTRNRKDNGEYLDVFKHCRSMTLLAAKAANVMAIDGVYTSLADKRGLFEESREAAQMGFDGKMTIHIDQVKVVHDAFAPTAKEVREAEDIVHYFENVRTGDGAIRVNDKMVDEPHYHRATKLLARKPPESREVPPPRPMIANGKWFEEFIPGMVIPHAVTRTVTETDNILFTTMSMNPAAIHLDYEASKLTEFKKPLFNSMATLAMVVGISVSETTHGTTVANLGFKEIVFHTPLFCGDTIHCDTKVLEVRESKSRPTQGVVTMEHRAYNQHGELACRAVRNAMIRKRPAKL